MKFKIISTGDIIIADLEFMNKYHPGDFVFVPEPNVSRKEVILARLIEIDITTDKPRTRRELALAKNATKVWLQGLDDEAVALRIELAGL
jgi:hypothetical protein